MCTISIIIPVYDKKDLLVNPLESVASQDRKGGFECILVDDGSTDGSGRMCDEWAERYPDVFRVFHQENRGRCAARNVGIANARGEWIAFMDCDDRIVPSFAANMIPYAEKYSSDPKVNVVQYGSARFNMKGRRRKGVEICKEEYLKVDGVFPGVEFCWDKLYRLSFLKSNGITFPEDSQIREDVIFNLWCLGLCGGIQRVPFEGYHKIDYPTSGYTLRTVSQLRDARRALKDLRKKLHSMGVGYPGFYRCMDSLERDNDRDIAHVDSLSRKLWYPVKRAFFTIFGPKKATVK